MWVGCQPIDDFPPPDDARPDAAVKVLRLPDGPNPVVIRGGRLIAHVPYRSVFPPVAEKVFLSELTQAIC